jgi:hypothetical protein
MTWAAPLHPQPHGCSALQHGGLAPISRGEYPARTIDLGRIGAGLRRQQWNDLFL